MPGRAFSFECLVINSTITSVPGLRVGHFTSEEAATGCTVVLCPPQGAVGGVEVRGSAPGTRETDLLRPSNLVSEVHAVLLSGGSTFGLDAAGGVMRYLEESNAGLKTSMGKTRTKFDLLEHGDNLCPLCRQPLGTGGQEHLRREYEIQGLQTKRQYTVNSSEQQKIGSEQREQAVHLSEVEIDVRRRRQKIEAELARSEQERNDSEGAQSELRLAVTEINKLENRIENGDFATWVDGLKRLLVLLVGHEIDNNGFVLNTQE